MTETALPPGIAPPEWIDLGDAVLRRWAPSDIDELLRAIDDSFDELHAWMPWAAQRPTREGVAEFLAQKADWPSDTGFPYGIVGDGQVLGTLAVHDRLGPGALEIGYWRRTGHGGRGLVTRAADAVTRVCLALPGIARVEIHCDPANDASAAVARRLGYRLDRTEPRAAEAPSETGALQIWVRTA